MDFSATATAEELVRYPTGSVAVSILESNGKLHYNFFREARSSRASATASRSAELCATFASNGSGSVQHEKGYTWLLINSKGGMELNDRGVKLQSWTWKELQEPLQYRMTAYFTLRIVDQRQVYIRMRGQKTIFDVGNRFAAACTVDVGHGALGATLHAGGSHSEASTLRTTLSSTQRISKSAVLSADPALRKVQENGWTLPRPSASGRETAHVVLGMRAGMKAAVAAAAEATASLPESSITRKQAAWRLRRPTGSESSKSTSTSHSRVPSAMVKRTVRRREPIPVFSARKFHQLMGVAPSTKVVFIALVLRGAPSCEDVLKLMSRYLVSAHITTEAKPLKHIQVQHAGSTSHPAAGNSDGNGSLEGQSQVGSEVAAVATSDRLSSWLEWTEGFDHAMVALDCNRPNTLQEKYGIYKFPTFLAFYGEHLLMASCGLQHQIPSDESLAQQMKELAQMARHGRHLPKDFRFKTARDLSLRDLGRQGLL